MQIHHTTQRTLTIFTACMFLAGCGTTQLHDPIPNAENRATPLSFGLYVTPDPDNNPIDPPERFEGFHAAVDYEVSSGEVDGDIPVYAICSGKVVYSGYAEGYGGLVIHRCKINGKHVTVLYGHLSLEDLPAQNSAVHGGETIALLADDRSYASGHNRKHLHLGIHKGKELELRGYVQTEEELDAYIDPAIVLPSFNIDLPGESPGETPYWQTEH